MPKRRPIFEFKGLSGFLGSSSSDSSYRARSSYTDESPRRPSFSISSRYRSSRQHHRRSSKRKRRHQHHKHQYSRRAHYVPDQRERQRRYQDELSDQYLGAKALARSLVDDDVHGDVLGHPTVRDRPRVTRFEDRDVLDRNIANRDVGNPSSDSARTHSDILRTTGSGSVRGPGTRERRHLGSPPPFDPQARAGYRTPSPEYPNGTHLSPELDRRAKQRVPRPSGYPDDYNPAERAVDPELEHSFNQSGLPEDSEEERRSARSYPGDHAKHAKRHASQGRRRHSKRKSGSRQKRRKRYYGGDRRRKDRDGSDDEGRDEGTRGARGDSEEPLYDEFGNRVQSAARGELAKSDNGTRGKSSQEDGKDKKGRKRNIAKVAALALGAVAVGLVARKIISKKKKKKEDAQAQAAAEQQEAAGPFGGEDGQLYSGSNPLQLSIPKTSFSVKVPEAEAFIVERGGKYNRRLNPGSNILIPFIDRVAFRFSLKEVSLAVPAQQCYTRENVSVMASALLFAKVEDAVAAAYGVDDAHRSLMLLAQTSMRKEIVRLGVEQMLQDRDSLGDRILGNMNRASRPWGVRCTRFEVRDLEIPEEVRVALEQQAQVERQAQADVLASQRTRDAMMNRADGEMHAQMRMSQAQQIDKVNQAIGEAHAISERGEAIAGAMRDVAEVLKEPGGEQAMQMRIAEQYIHSYANAAKNQGQLPPLPNAADVAAAISSAMGLVRQPGSTVTNPYVASGEMAAKPVAALEQQQAIHTQSGDDLRPPMAASSASDPSAGASSPHISQSQHHIPQVYLGTPQTPTGTQPLPHNASRLPQNAAASPHGSLNISNNTNKAQTPTRKHLTTPDGQYVGPMYPQASHHFPNNE